MAIIKALPKKKCNLRAYFITNTIQLKMSTKTTGTVKFFNADKGFGFIKHDDSNKETFVHASGLIDQVKENDHVEFDLQNGKKGLNAVNVKLI
jgi:CspA family cold shock protein